MQRRFEAGDQIGIEPHEAALHLDVQAAGIGRGAADPAVVDHRDLDTLGGEEAGERESHDAAADHQRSNRRHRRMRCLAHGAGDRARSAMVSGLTGGRGAKLSAMSPPAAAIAAFKSGPQ